MRTELGAVRVESYPDATKPDERWLKITVPFSWVREDGFSKKDVLWAAIPLFKDPTLEDLKKCFYVATSTIDARMARAEA